MHANVDSGRKTPCKRRATDVASRGLVNPTSTVLVYSEYRTSTVVLRVPLVQVQYLSGRRWDRPPPGSASIHLWGARPVQHGSPLGSPPHNGLLEVEGAGVASLTATKSP
jgi:hypothetical protein